ncbi:MAG: hypothetical protein KOO61_03265, partial [Spirochaetales bacterium]|nr:hypothetical protein [Spirochaetales bacterium]
MHEAMHGVMRKFTLLLATLVLLYSCATTEEEPVDEIVVIDDETISDTVEPLPVEPDDVEDVVPVEVVPDEQPVEVEAIVEAAPAPGLILIEPTDLSVLDSLEFLIAARLDSDEGGVPSAIEVQLLSGPIVSGDFEAIDSSTLPAPQRTRTIRLSDLGAAAILSAGDPATLPEVESLRAAAAVSVPAGLIDGEIYVWRARGVLSDGGYTEWIADQHTRLHLGFGSPAADPHPATIDSTPVLTWQMDEEFLLYRVRLLDSANKTLGEVVSRAGSHTVPLPLSAGRYRFTVSGLRSDGFATRFSDPATVRILGDAIPSPVWPRGGEMTLGASVGLHWTAVTGAVGYQAQYRV